MGADGDECNIEVERSQYLNGSLLVIHGCHIQISLLFPVPRDPPTQVEIRVVENRGLTIAWATPSSCQGHGGRILSYVIQYRVEGSSIFTDSVDTMSASGLQYSLTDLTPDTNYQLRVASRNAQGAGTYSSVVTATTPPIPSKYLT